MSTGPDALSPTSYLVLGLVDLLGRATSYDLKRMVGVSIGYFWAFPHSQLYAEPNRLADAGLLSVEEEEGGRRRRVYSVTDAGREALREWLADPATERFELRDAGLLKLFFGGLARPADVATLAEAQAERYRQALAELATIEAGIGDDDLLAYPLLTLELGKRVAEAYVEFWDDVAARRARRPYSSSR